MSDTRAESPEQDDAKKLAEVWRQTLHVVEDERNALLGKVNELKRDLHRAKAALEDAEKLVAVDAKLREALKGYGPCDCGRNGGPAEVAAAEAEVAALLAPDAGSILLSVIENKYRDTLWRNHGCRFAALYGDDGERQCNGCGLDFNRTPLDELEKRLWGVTLAHLGDPFLLRHPDGVEGHFCIARMHSPSYSYAEFYNQGGWASSGEVFVLGGDK